METRPARYRPEFAFKFALVWLLCSLVSPIALAEQLSSGTNSRQAKKQAINSIPYNQLTPETRQKIATVVDNPSIYRRLPITAVDVDPDMFLFLVRYPEVIVNIWEIMGVTQMKVDRTGPFTLNSDDGAGAISDVELVYGTNDKHIFYANGTYSGPLLKRKLKGRAVLILKTNYTAGPDGKPKSTNSLDVFVKVDNTTVNLIAKTLNPVVGPTADHNFVESLNFVQRLNETTEQNGVGVQRMAGRLTNIDDQVRQKFVEIAGWVYERNTKSRSTQSHVYAKPAVIQKPNRASSIKTALPPREKQRRPSQFGIRRTAFFERLGF